jgi:hypothetical protein
MIQGYIMKLIPILTVFFFLSLSSLSVHAQRNVSKGADEAFDRKQYSLAIDRYKKPMVVLKGTRMRETV